MRIMDSGQSGRRGGLSGMPAAPAAGIQSIARAWRSVQSAKFIGLRKFTLGNNGVEPTYEIMIEPVP